MVRSVWKGPFVDGHLIKKVQTHLKESSNKPIKTWSRRSTILPQFVGITFNVIMERNLYQFLFQKRWLVKTRRICPTRTYYGHTADKKAKIMADKTDNKKQALQKLKVYVLATKVKFSCKSIRGCNIKVAIDQLTFSKKRYQEKF